MTRSERRFEFVLRLTRESILARKESRKVLSDDLMGLVAEEALGPGVPTQQLSLEPDEEDGVLLGICR
jgi:hypothetical protein